jgi:hypothetical protein
VIQVSEVRRAKPENKAHKAKQVLRVRQVRLELKDHKEFKEKMVNLLMNFTEMESMKLMLFMHLLLGINLVQLNMVKVKLRYLNLEMMVLLLK